MAKELEHDSAALLARFREQMKALGGQHLLASPMALAVSGGSDSVALMCLAASWAKNEGAPLPIVLTVDHGLRPEAKEEAKQVTFWASALGLSHHILEWRGEKPSSNIQASARQARYELMAAFCQEHALTCLVTAHTQDDQAETLLLRLARGSGIDGLAAMQASAPLPLAGYEDVRLLRPLLEMGRDELHTYLSEREQPWIDDPSNEDSSFARVRMRAILPLLAKEGLTTERLADAATHMGEARAVLEAQTQKLSASCVRYDPAGYAELDMGLLKGASLSLAMRLLVDVLRQVGGGHYRPRYDALMRLWEGMSQGHFKGRTLAGCRLLPMDNREKVLVVREWRSLAASERSRGPLFIGPGLAKVWDNRFDVKIGSADPVSEDHEPIIEIRPLGEEGWRQAQDLALHSGQSVERQVIPAPVRASLPALWCQDQLAAAPHLGVIDKRHFPADWPEAPQVAVRFMKVVNWLSC